MKIPLWLVLLSVISCCGATQANEYMTSASILRVRIHEQNVYVGFAPQPANTCTDWGEHMIFSHRTEEGKVFLTTLLAAKVADKQVQAWYQASTTPGKDQGTGCHAGTAAVLKGVALP